MEKTRKNREKLLRENCKTMELGCDSGLWKHAPAFVVAAVSYCYGYVPWKLGLTCLVTDQIFSTSSIVPRI